MNRDYLPKDKRLLPSEGEEQARLFSWCRMQSWQHPELGLLFHIPNGGSRNKAEAGRFKAEGVKAGVPDLLLPVARGGYHGLFIELKRLDGGRVSPEQKAWMDKLKEQGYQAVVCRGWEEASEALLGYLAAGEESGPSQALRASSPRRGASQEAGTSSALRAPAELGTSNASRASGSPQGEGYGRGEGKEARA